LTGQHGRYHRLVFLFLVALFIVIPLIEIAVIIQVGQWLGVFNTIGLLLLVSVMGAWLVKRQGLGVWRRIRDQQQAGQVPAAAVFDGALILMAGALLLFPGFVTDVFGLLLLLPPVRAGVRAYLRRRYMARVQVVRSVRTATWSQTERPPYPPPPSRPEPPRSIPPRQ
jgi:UPF0716 protein FxsA